MSGTSDARTTDVDVSPSDATTSPPPLSALFLIVFDQKVGYSIAWKKSIANVPLDGTVEFKSLPSGLHTVKEDLVYFVHEGYAGLSAFVNGPASEAERNAHLVAVGILVPLSYGRLGRSWLHAQALQNLSATLVDDVSQTEPLESYWEKFGSSSEKEASKSPNMSSGSNSNSSYKTHSRNRALSTLTAVLPSDQSLPPWHPALSIVKYIDTFGPLVFPLQRAALLRKRILFMTSAPVRPACEFVYDLSILSSIPGSVSELLPPGSESLHRLKSLFTLGIHDIPLLEKLAVSHGAAVSPDEDGAYSWVACTTDEILTIKQKLYDIIVEIPAATEHRTGTKCWPTIKTSSGAEIKASQRDLRRFKLLHHELWKIRHRVSSPHDHDDEDSDDHTALLLHDMPSDADIDTDEGYDDTLIEPMTWAQLAYSGFMWWASAGEQDSYLTEEANGDREILGDISDFVPGGIHVESNGNGTDPMTASGLARTGLHTAIIAYFHRLTSLLVTNIADLVECSDDEDIGGEEGVNAVVQVTSEDIARMGLEAWSESDKAFVKEFLATYFGREAEVHGANLECCGVRIC